MALPDWASSAGGRRASPLRNARGVVGGPQELAEGARAVRAALERLRAEIRSDRDAVSRWLDELAALDLVADTRRNSLAQAAWSLHHSYSGIEAILERTMRTLEGSLPEGPDSQKALLEAAGLRIEGIREPLLSKETVAAG